MFLSAVSHGFCLVLEAREGRLGVLVRYLRTTKVACWVNVSEVWYVVSDKGSVNVCCCHIPPHVMIACIKMLYK